MEDKRFTGPYIDLDGGRISEVRNYSRYLGSVQYRLGNDGLVQMLQPIDNTPVDVSWEHLPSGVAALLGADPHTAYAEGHRFKMPGATAYWKPQNAHVWNDAGDYNVRTLNLSGFMITN